MRPITQGKMFSTQFNARHASYITGATYGQLYSWRKEGLITAEYAEPGELQWIYSYRDLVVLRLVAYVRAKYSMSALRNAFRELDREKLNADMDSFVIRVEGDDVLLTEAFRPFTNHAGRDVPDFEQPFPHIASTTTVEMVRNGEFKRSLNVPEVTAEEALEAIQIHQEIQRMDRRAA